MSAPDHRAPLLLVLVFLLSLPGVTRRLYAADEIQFFAYLRSVWFDRDVSFENEYRHFADAGIASDALFRETFLERRSATGLRLNFGTIGSAILWSPFYAVADLGVVAARVAGVNLDRDGYGQPYVAAVCYGSAVYGLLAILLAGSVARRVLGWLQAPARGSVSAVVAVWFGTPLVFYMYVAPGMAHATSAFAVALFVWLWLRVRDTWSIRGLAGLGAAAALMTMVREQDAFFALGTALDFVWTMIRTRRWRAVLGAAAGAVAFVITFLPQAWAYLALNGRLGPSQVTARKMDWLSPHALDVLVSPQHGYFAWTPLAALALGGLVVLSRARVAPDVPAGTTARIAICLGVMVLGQVYVTGAVASWTLAGAFGQRRFLALTVILVVGLATMWSQLRSRAVRGLFGAVVALGIWWNLGLMVQFGVGSMDRQRLTLRENTYQTFVAVPRALPTIVYRYFFDRQSFYRTGAGSPAGR